MLFQLAQSRASISSPLLLQESLQQLQQHVDNVLASSFSLCFPSLWEGGRLNGNSWGVILPGWNPLNDKGSRRSGWGSVFLLLVLIGSFLFGLRSLNPRANGSANAACGALLGDGFACVVAAVVRGSFAHPACCHRCRTRHLACAWEEGSHVSWMQDFKNLFSGDWSCCCVWCPCLLQVFTTDGFSESGQGLWGGKAGFTSPRTELSAYWELGPHPWEAERREGPWHCIWVERGWVGFILPLEHRPQKNGIPGLYHLPQQGKRDEKQWSTQLHNEKQ